VQSSRGGGFDRICPYALYPKFDRLVLCVSPETFLLCKSGNFPTTTTIADAKSRPCAALAQAWCALYVEGWGIPRTVLEDLGLCASWPHWARVALTQLGHMQCPAQAVRSCNCTWLYPHWKTSNPHKSSAQPRTESTTTFCPASDRFWLSQSRVCEGVARPIGTWGHPFRYFLTFQVLWARLKVLLVTNSIEETANTACPHIRVCPHRCRPLLAHPRHSLWACTTQNKSKRNGHGTERQSLLCCLFMMMQNAVHRL
jgi:hypothetical protein